MFGYPEAGMMPNMQMVIGFKILMGPNEIASAFTTDLGQNEFSYEFSADAEYRKKFKKAGRFTGGALILGRN